MDKQPFRSHHQMIRHEKMDTCTRPIMFCNIPIIYYNVLESAYNIQSVRRGNCGATLAATLTCTAARRYRFKLGTDGIWQAEQCGGVYRKGARLRYLGVFTDLGCGVQGSQSFFLIRSRIKIDCLVLSRARGISYCKLDRDSQKHYVIETTMGVHSLLSIW